MNLALSSGHKALLKSTCRARLSSCNSSHSSKRARARGITTTVVRRSDVFTVLDTFQDRHIGPNTDEAHTMLKHLGYKTMDDFVAASVPQHIRIASSSVSNEAIIPLTETEMLERAGQLAAMNKVHRSYIGMGYHNAVVPKVIQRNIFESPAWYTQYTPYQPEIAQGRLESLINFQTMVTSLTGLDISNASLLDEATAAAEAMALTFATLNQKKRTFVVDLGVSPQTLAVLRTRAKGFDVKLAVCDVHTLAQDDPTWSDICGVLVQYPDVDGHVKNFEALASRVHEHGGLVTCATDLLALTLLKPPGEWGADIAFGNSARFGVPLGYGGPHAAFFSVKDQLKRKMPGRLVGRSKDCTGKPAYRLALQTREQHIRREKATSNICTSQALLANMAAMYAVYHGASGLTKIAKKVNGLTQILRNQLESMGYKVVNTTSFDTITVDVSSVPGAATSVLKKALDNGINLRPVDQTHVGVTLDESVLSHDLLDLVNVFGASKQTSPVEAAQLSPPSESSIPQELVRTSEFLQHPVFNCHHSETEMLRYIYNLQNKDLSLCHSMIPLGSCTMKLNSTASMIPLSWEEFSNIHPFVPEDQARGYHLMIKELERDLCTITGFHSCSLQPNSGASGEYAGLCVIRAYHESRGEGHRDICLIPLSAHGTNPASAIMAGMKVVPVKALNDGSLDLEDLSTKAKLHKDNLAAFMITYPSTFGVFEDGVQEACKIIHANGGQVYLDGANLNAQIGLTNPFTCGGDVCHLNLHKTFSIPHGGGGPGVGPICVSEHLAPFLPGHPLVATGGSSAIDAMAAAPWGSASILLISWAYIKMLGGKGLTDSSILALLSANYIAYKLRSHYTVRYKNANGRVAHELLIDLAEFDKSAGLKVTDFAKRLQDYGFHPPTCSWPISTAMLIEPTESETVEELDRFCDAMIQIRKEVDEIISGAQPRENNVLKNAPHPISAMTCADSEWNRPYSRQVAAYPLPYLHERKFWPTVSRINDAYGDINLMCECPSVEEATSIH
ncbi:glycine decarboxylase subunit P [Tulasnella sp. 330]|nr:glycine decarboxylase subunit P [Tulasnella sp. 330]KAG8883298.1 glycine decarboxylase subunit P [Tulasnella sp. 331]KAG8888681.1 glycine decarboxylase subunit P [Tulasnella sp. 332]